jgi:hypothetical protein
MDQSSTTGSSGRTRTTTRRGLKKTSKKAARGRITAKFLKKWTVSNKVVHSTADEAGTSSTSIKGSNQEIRGRIKNGKRVDGFGLAAKKVTRRLVKELRTANIASVAGKKRDKTVRIKIQGKRSAKRESSKIKVQAGLNKGANIEIHGANKLMIKVTIR